MRQPPDLQDWIIHRDSDTGSQPQGAKIAGGAKMFEVSGASAIGNVGLRNAQASKAKLKQLGIPLLAEDTGLNYGRTVELYPATGEFYIKAVGKKLKII